MTTINKIESSRAQQFAIACYDTNDVNQLKNALAAGPDQTDMKTWGISEDEWREAIEAALHDKIADNNE